MGATPVVFEMGPAEGKPIVIEKKGRSWFVFVHGDPVVNVAAKGQKPSLTYRARSPEAEGKQPFPFKSRSDAEGIAFTIGRYALKLGDFMYSYVEVRGAPALADNPLAVEGPTVEASPWAKLSRDAAAHVENVELSAKVGAIEDGRDVYRLVHDGLAKESQEVFLAIPCDLRGRLKAPPTEIARGQPDRVAVGMSDLVAFVTGTKCKYFFVVHNHPSGSATPSPADRALTKTIQEAVDALGDDGQLADHIVVGTNEFYSFAEGKLFREKPRAASKRDRKKVLR